MPDSFPYRIQGDDMQMVEIKLAPGQELVGEAGAMMYLDEGVDFEVKVGKTASTRGGFLGTIVQGATRMIAGESIFVTHYYNRTNTDQVVAFSSELPGKIITLELGDYGGSIIAQKDAFLCGAHDTAISIQSRHSIGTGFFGGEGFFLQRIHGAGQIFLSAGGMIIERELRGDKLRVDTGAVVAFESQIKYDIERAGSLKSMMFGGEGLFLATLEGNGKVWLQSMPIGRLVGIISSHLPSNK